MKQNGETKEIGRQYQMPLTQLSNAAFQILALVGALHFRILSL